MHLLLLVIALICKFLFITLLKRKYLYNQVLYNIFGLILLSEYLISTYLIWGTLLATEFMGFMGEISMIF